MEDSTPTRHENATRWADAGFTEMLNHLLHAVEDCGREGVSPVEDPTVHLIADRLGRTVNVTAENRFDLIRACEEAAEAFRARPLLLQLVSRQIAHDETRKLAFHKEARRLLLELAIHLKLRPGGYDVRSNRGGPAVSGEITLHADEIYAQVSIPSFSGGGREVLYRRCRGREDFVGGGNHFASAAELCQPAMLARRIARDLGLGGA